MSSHTKHGGRVENQPLPISWDQNNRMFTILLRGFVRTEETQQLEIKWSPHFTYVVRIREVGEQKWSYGFETPVTGCGFSGLSPNTEYEFKLTTKNSQGIESSPVYIRAHTTSDGSLRQTS